MATSSQLKGDLDLAPINKTFQASMNAIAAFDEQVRNVEQLTARLNQLLAARFTPPRGQPISFDINRLPTAVFQPIHKLPPFSSLRAFH